MTHVNTIRWMEPSWACVVEGWVQSGGEAARLGHRRNAL